MLLASSILGLPSPSGPAFRSNSGMDHAGGHLGAHFPKRNGLLETSRRARQMNLVLLFVPSPKGTSHFRRGWPCVFAWLLRFGFGLFRRRRSGRFLSRFSALPADQRQSILGVEGKAAHRHFAGGA